MKVKKVLLDVLLVIAGILGTLFLVYCSSGGSTPIFVPDPTVPTVSISALNYNPCFNEFPVYPGNQFYINFSEEMNDVSVLGHIEVEPAVAFTVQPNTNNSSGYILEMPNALDYATTYRITVTAGALDKGSQPLPSDYEYTFRTELQGPPRVIESYLNSFPTEETVLVDNLQSARVVFYEAMSVSSVLDHLSVAPAVSFSTQEQVWAYGFPRGRHDITLVFSSMLDKDTVYSITVGAGAQDMEGELLQSDHIISFSMAPSTSQPFVLNVSPAPGATNVEPTYLRPIINFSKQIDQIDNDGKITVDPPVSFEISHNGNQIELVMVQFEHDTAYTITVPTTIVDTVGNSLLYTVTSTFTTVTPSPPMVTGSDPDNGDTGVSITTSNTAIEFSEVMARISCENAFSIAPSVSHTFFWNSCGDVLFTQLDRPLAYSTVYTVTMGVGANDLMGEDLQSSYVFSFTTEPLPRPMVDMTYPADGATDIPVDTTARVYFSKKMDSLSAIQAVTVSPDPGPLSKSYLSGPNSVEVIFLSGLDPDTQYTVTVAAGAEDTEGYALASDYTFSFTTVPECAVSCGHYDITLDPDQSVYDLDQPITYTLVSSIGITPCIEDVDWYHNDVLNLSDEILTGYLITSMAGTNTIRAETSGLSDCTVSVDYYVEPLCPSSCSAITFDEPDDSAQFLAGDEFSLVLGGKVDCVENVIFSSNADGVLGSGPITSLITSLSTTTTHTLSAQVISTGLATCNLNKTVSVLDCPVSCDDINLTEPSSLHYLLGDDVPYALGGNTLCLEDVVWSLTGDSQALTTGLSGTLTGLSPGGYTISADVKSTLLATCQKAQIFTVLPCPSTCGQYSMTLPAENEFFSGDTVAFALAAAGEATFDCADNVIWESDIDGVINSGQALSTIAVSDLSPDTHTITASIVSSTLETCTVSKMVTVLDCPDDCVDITFDLPIETTYNYGNNINFALGGMLDCVQNVLWSSDADGFLGSGPTMTSLTTSALSITTHTITAAVKSYSLATCEKTKQVQILPFMGSDHYPDTGQTTCYDNTHALQASSCPAVGATFYGQDASYIDPPPAMSLVANGDSTVTDNNTGLIWQQGYNGGFGHVWQSAVDACDSLSLAGTNSWRLPKRRELVTITDFGRSYPALNTTVFEYLYGMEAFWSATSSAAAASYAWLVDTGMGNLTSDHVTSPVQYYEAYSRCVLGDPLPAANLTNNGDSTVTDSVSNLMWQDGIWATASTITWEEALAYCENLSLAAYTDWKLPDIRELESLVDTDSYSPAIDTTAFNDQSNIDQVFWSSTTAGLSQDAWAINFNTGGTGSGTKTSMGFKIYVRCVRMP